MMQNWNFKKNNGVWVYMMKSLYLKPLEMYTFKICSSKKAKFDDHPQNYSDLSVNI